jgi:hypothetical protein
MEIEDMALTNCERQRRWRAKRQAELEALRAEVARLTALLAERDAVAAEVSA